MLVIIVNNLLSVVDNVAFCSAEKPATLNGGATIDGGEKGSTKVRYYRNTVFFQKIIRTAVTDKKKDPKTVVNYKLQNLYRNTLL